MAAYKLATVPSHGDRITYENDVLNVPNNPIIPYVEGDGTGADIWRASVRVFDAAVEKAYGGERRVAWMGVFAGEKAFTNYKDWLPQETIDAMQEFRVSIKGPLTTPVGGGIRSLNVTLRQVLDLYACIRPVRYFEGVGSPMKEPRKLDIVVFRENTEDVYAGIEWKAGSPEAEKLRQFIERELGKHIRPDSAIGIKPMSEFGSKRLVDMAIRYALKHDLPSVTLMHKGNIMKFTEGAFRDWGYEVAREVVGDVLRLDRVLQTAHDERGGFVPAEILEHHHTGQDHAARVDLVEVRVLGRRAVRRLEHGHSVADVSARCDAKAAHLRGRRVGDVVAIQVRRRNHGILIRPKQ